MIRAAIVALAVTLSVTYPSHAHGPIDQPIERLTLERGEIRGFFSRAYAVYGKNWSEVDAMAFEQDRIWTGEAWLPLSSHQGAQFLMQIEREIRAGKFDSE